MTVEFEIRNEISSFEHTIFNMWDLLVELWSIIHSSVWKSKRLKIKKLGDLHYQQVKGRATSKKIQIYGNKDEII